MTVAKTDLIGMCCIAVSVALAAVVIAGTLSYGSGLREGAKIALSKTNYRLDEVRADCTTLFRTAECAECHTID